MSNYYAPCFYKVNFVVIPSYIEVPGYNTTEMYKLSLIIKSDTSITSTAAIKYYISFQMIVAQDLI